VLSATGAINFHDSPFARQYFSFRGGCLKLHSRDIPESVNIMTTTVIEYVLSRLRDIGITDVFGVAGDYVEVVTGTFAASPLAQARRSI
jgi:choline kinase